MSSGWNDTRPLSPFTTIWRWHVSMVVSILHRASGIALGAGTLVMAAWLVALAAGEQQYIMLMGLLSSWPGRGILFAFTLALFFHLLNGIRYLVWDSGHGFDKQTATRASWLVMILAVLLAVALWVTGYWLFEAFPGQVSH
ncbi:Succinate dehydrogenase cytochrome b-556 subunit [hydrothermal vent metagenome]|uniref:Succinate dehydrogenase cytochrome b-556 subunit n=1 Tax=hydrothermal vent metagenome TaxID=652676 RepID=A0A3B0RGA7_9ZZZZ